MEQRESPSWVDINLTNLGVTRFIGNIGRTGAEIVYGAAPRVATIYGDGHVLASFVITGYTPVTPFNIDISGVTILRIHYQAIGPAHEGGVSLAMFDMYLQ